VADPDIRLGGGQFNMFPSISRVYLFVGRGQST